MLYLGELLTETGFLPLWVGGRHLNLGFQTCAPTIAALINEGTIDRVCIQKVMGSKDNQERKYKDQTIRTNWTILAKTSTIRKGPPKLIWRNYIWHNA
jgi:hypothetical protein